MPREVFIAGQILTAAELNSVSDQTVMSFAGTAARGSAIPSPVEGMVSYIEASPKGVEVYDGSSWKRVANTSGSVLQVVSTTKTDTFTSSSASFTDITGLSLTITPSSATSKIVVLSYVNWSQGAVGAHFRVLRGSTPLAVGDAASSRIQSTFSGTGSFSAGGFGMFQASFVFLDSPSSTSALTYKIDGRTGTSGAFTINRYALDNDNADYGRAVSTLTLMEIAG